MTASKPLILALFSVLAFELSAQTASSKLWLQGKITVLELSDSSEKPVGLIPITLHIDTILISQIESARNGHYQLQLEYDHVYTLSFGGTQYMKKTIVIDTREVSGKTLRKGYRMDLDISLFFNDDPEVALVLSQPIAKAFFDKKSDQFVFDQEYVEERLRLLTLAFR
jgi:hypothetical protein